MKYLKSTTQKAYTVKGYTIPKCITPKNDYLILNDSEYSEIEKIPVIKSLIKAGGIFISDKEPSDSIKNIESLETTNAQLIARATELELKLKELERKREVGEVVNIAKIKEDAQAEIKAQAIQELQEKQDALDAAQKEIEELKAQLSSKKAKKVSAESSEEKE